MGHIQYIAGNFMMMGRNVSSWMNFDDVYSADFFASLPEVDAGRLSCMGFSMGPTARGCSLH